MRCPYCGLLQDEPGGVKQCLRCGGGLEFEKPALPGKGATYLQVQLELDQVAAPAGTNLERYLLLTIRTPDAVPVSEAAPAGKPRPPLNFAPVLDVSGSMQGDKIVNAREAVRQAVRCLHDGDVFSLVTFSDKVASPFKPADVVAGTIAAVEAALKEIAAGGMTALCGGLDMGIKNALKHKKDANLVLLLSDGQANVGETDLERVGKHALEARQKGLLVSTLGVGMDYNEALMTEIATQGGGRFYHIENAAMIPVFVAGELGEVAALAARDCRLTLDLPAGATLVPLSAAYPVQQAGSQAVVSVGDIPCGTELEIPLRLALLAQPVGAKLSVEGRLEFRSPAGNALTHTVNRVTVRFVKKGEFQLREGVVLPVAERVFTQMKAAGVLDFSRASTRRPQDAARMSKSIQENLFNYAELLGEERAGLEKDTISENMVSFAASPAAAKQAVNRAFRTQRSTKDFDKKS